MSLRNGPKCAGNWTKEWRISRSSVSSFELWPAQRKTASRLNLFHDKDSDIAFSKTAFELRAKSALWLFVHGTRVLIVVGCTRKAAFYLPSGWFGPAEWFLSLPMAPKGNERSLLKVWLVEVFISSARCGQCWSLDISVSPGHQTSCGHL